MRLLNARVTSYSTNTQGGGDFAVDSFSLRPSRIEWSYAKQSPTGQLQNPVVACWDLQAGTMNSGPCP